MKNDSTEACKAKIVEARPDTKESDWKRIKKFGDADRSTRFFIHKPSGATAAVIYQKYHYFGRKEFQVYFGDAIPVPEDGDVKSLVDACATIKHCGDYCNLYWNPKRKWAWLTMGDGDCGDDGPYTPMDDIKKLLEDAGASNVIVEAEHDPEESEGYIEIGVHLGQTVEWE